MIIQALLYFLAAILEIFLGLFIIFRNIRSKFAFSLFLLIFSTFVWQVGSGVAIIFKDADIALAATRIAFLGIVLIPITTYHLALDVLNLKKTVTLYIGYILSLVFISLSHTPFMLNGVNDYSWGYFFKAGSLHPIFMVFFVYLMAVIFIHLYKSYKQESVALEKNRKKYFFAALFMAYIGAIDFIPTYGIGMQPFSYLAVIACVSIFAYAIVAYRLMDIEVVIKKTLVFAGLFASVFIISAAIITLISTFIMPVSKDNIYLFAGITIAIFILLHDPLKNFLVTVTNKFLFQKKYDPRKVLKDFSNEALTILNLDKLSKATVDTLVNNFYITNCAILLLGRDELGFEMYDSFGLENKTLYFNTDSSLANSFKGNSLPLLYESYDKKLQATDSVKKDMDKIQSQICMPLIIHDELVGILSLGAKKSDESYAADDIDILMTLIKTLSIAISNARLFMQAAQNEKLATIGTITSAINHEVSNPLGLVSVAIQLFISKIDRGEYKDYDKLLSKVKEMMQDFEKQLRKVISITGKLSIFAKPSKIIESKAINIVESVDEALILLSHKLKMDKITIEKHIPKNLPKITVDENQMQQIFFNLIRNAAEAIEKNGTITIIANEESDKVKIKIQDTGSGIPEDRLDRIFKPFYTTKGEAKGSGYGLAVVKELVQRNNGSIRAKSKSNEGTTFYLEFPKT